MTRESPAAFGLALPGLPGRSVFWTVVSLDRGVLTDRRCWKSACRPRSRSLDRRSSWSSSVSIRIGGPTRARKEAFVEAPMTLLRSMRDCRYIGACATRAVVWAASGGIAAAMNPPRTARNPDTHGSDRRPAREMVSDQPGHRRLQPDRDEQRQPDQNQRIPSGDDHLDQGHGHDDPSCAGHSDQEWGPPTCGSTRDGPSAGNFLIADTD